MGALQLSPSAILRMVPRRILPERVFGSRATAIAILKAATGPILSRTSATSSLLDLGRRGGDPALEHGEAAWRLALERILDADHRTFGDRRMRGDHLLHAAGRETVTRDIDDVVGAAHHVDIAVLVEKAGIGRLVVAREIRRDSFRACAHPPATASGRQPGGKGSFTTIEPMVFGGHGRRGLVDDLQVVARHGHGRRAVLHRQEAKAERIAGDAPAGLGLPPMIDDRLPRGCARPRRRCRDRRARPRGTARSGRRHRSAPGAWPRDPPCLMARKAVGAVKKERTLCSDTTRQ